MRDTEPPLHGLRVLVVEHDRESRDVLQQALEFFGARVTAVGSAEEARRRLQSTPPDVLVADIELDGETVELLTWLRARPGTRIARVPAVALTAHRDDLETGDAEGFDERLLKPVRADDLCAAIRRAASVADRHRHRHRA
jgi:CheY-like chemotaxis protein